MNELIEKAIVTLANRAITEAALDTDSRMSDRSADRALKFTQAACNIVNAATCWKMNMKHRETK